MPITTLTFIAAFGLMIYGMIYQYRFQKKMDKYKEKGISAGLTGKEIASRMLSDHGIHDVKITATPGKLTDHFDPAQKTVNLSPDVYKGRSIMAASVAAHECGHAIQQAEAYSWLQLRSAMVPAVSFSNKMLPFLLLAGIGFLFFANNPTVLGIAIIAFAATTLFSFVTLPVEFDASRRAVQWLNSSGLTSGAEHKDVQGALKGAAMTYVIGALGSLAMLLHYVMIFLGSQE